MDYLIFEKNTQIDWKKLETVFGLKKDLIPVVIQDYVSKDVLILAYTNKDAFLRTMKEKKVYLWSSTNNEEWEKGKTSGSILRLKEARINCDQNSFLYLVETKEEFGYCHNKQENGQYFRSCFYRSLIIIEE